MIVFFNKKTGEILGGVEGRVHPAHHEKMNISISGIDPADIGKIIIGWTEDDQGKRMSHNLHLWEYQLAVEDPKHPKHNLGWGVETNKDKTVFNLKPLFPNQNNKDLPSNLK